MNYKKFILLSLAVLLLGLGCKGATQEELSLVRPTSLEYWTVFNDVEMLRTFAKEYQAGRPYVRINIRQVRFEELEKLFVNALADDVPPDIISLHVRDLRRHRSRLSPMPAEVQVADIRVTEGVNQQTIVTPRVFQLPTPNQIAQGYVSTVKDDVIVDGQIYGLPLAIDTLALYYNTELLDKAGVIEPPRDWTAFTDAVKRGVKFDSEQNLVQIGVPMGLASNIDNHFDIFSLLLMQNGLKIEENRFVTFATDVNLSTELHPAFTAFRFYTDFARPERNTYTWNARQNSALEEFSRGRSLFYLGYAFDRARIELLGPQLPYAIVPVPQLNADSPANVANYWVETVTAKSDSQNEAWDFVRYITEPERVARYVEVTGQPSPIRSHVRTQQEDPLLEPFVSQLLVARNWYHGNDGQAAENAITNMIGSSHLPPRTDSNEIRRDVELLQQASFQIQQTY